MCKQAGRNLPAGGAAAYGSRRRPKSWTYESELLNAVFAFQSAGAS